MSKQEEVTPVSLVTKRLKAFKEYQVELEEELGCNEHRVQVAKNSIAENEAKIKEFEEWLSEHAKPVERDESVLFEARAPDGNMYRVFEDGSAEGFPEGTAVSNYWIPMLHYAAGLTKKARDDGLISEEQASHLFLGRFPACGGATTTRN